MSKDTRRKLSEMLRELKLPGVQATFGEAAIRAEKGGWDFERYLHHVLEVDARVRVERQHDPQEAVGGDLGQDRGEGRQHGQRHRQVPVGHPSVDRERRHLHQERRSEPQLLPLHLRRRR